VTQLIAEWAPVLRGYMETLRRDTDALNEAAERLRCTEPMVPPTGTLGTTVLGALERLSSGPTTIVPGLEHEGMGHAGHTTDQATRRRHPYGPLPALTIELMF
jgi:hypothetical protein